MTGLLILACILGFGMWSVCEAKALTGSPPISVLVAGLLTSGAAGLALSNLVPKSASAAGVGWAIAASVCSLGAIAAYLALVARVPNHIAASATAVYPLVPVAVALATGQQIGARAALGIALAIAGAVLLSAG